MLTRESLGANGPTNSFRESREWGVKQQQVGGGARLPGQMAKCPLATSLGPTDSPTSAPRAKVALVVETGESIHNALHTLYRGAARQDATNGRNVQTGLARYGWAGLVRGCEIERSLGDWGKVTQKTLASVGQAQLASAFGQNIVWKQFESANLQP